MPSRASPEQRPAAPVRIATIALLITLATLSARATDLIAVPDEPVPRETAIWDPVQVSRIVNDARRIRSQGDLAAAERLCRNAFQIIDQSALAGYDAYAELEAVEHLPDEQKVRGHAARLHEIKEAQAHASQPTSSYLGFSPAEGLNAYADLLKGLQREDDAARIRSLARAYQQVQQTHFRRTMLFEQGKDPRGSC